MFRNDYVPVHDTLYKDAKWIKNKKINSKFGMSSCSFFIFQTGEMQVKNPLFAEDAYPKQGGEAEGEEKQ